MTAFFKYMALTSGLLLAVWQGAIAQTRYCDIANTLIDPGAGAFIAPYAHFDLRIQLRNNGPDDLLAGDTIYYNTSMDFSQSYTPYILTQPINAGDSAEIFLMEVANNNQNPADETALFCVKIRTFPQQAISDTATANNNSCNSVTFGGIDPPPSSIDELSGAHAAFSVYPNPAEEWLEIKMKDQHPKQATILLTDLTGRSLQSFHWPEGQESLRILVSELDAGIYIINLKTETQQSFLKFVKQ